MKAQVYKIHSDFYYVKKQDSDELLECKLREILKKQKIKIKVGDFVEIEPMGAIAALFDRKNTISRPAVSNLDFCAVISSILEPSIDFVQLNRYLTFLKYHNIEAILCFNKDDLVDSVELKRIKEEILKIYKPLGYKIIFTSIINNDGLLELEEYAKGKTIAFCGQSGVGKSSILNALSNKFIRTGDVSQKSKRGTHTTRHVEIIEFKECKIIDTPGFSRLVFDFLLPKDLGKLFPDINAFSDKCRFTDCLHTSEDEDCGVIKNLDKIAKSRYESYLSFLEEAKEYKKRVTFESQKEESGLKTSHKKTFAKISTKKREFSRKKLNQNIYGEEND